MRARLRGRKAWIADAARLIKMTLRVAILMILTIICGCH
jgi:hypothetical protein